MNIPAVNNNYDRNTNFGAIFNLRKTSNSLSQTVIDAVKNATVPAEAQKIEKKFQIGGGSLYVYVPDENLEKLLQRLNSRITPDAQVDFITRVD